MNASFIEFPGDDAPSAPWAAKAGHVLSWAVNPGSFCSEHELATRRAHAERLAALKGYSYFGEVGTCSPPAVPLYYVPSDTLVAQAAAALRISSEEDLFGGVVPHPYVATKAISHPLHGAAPHAPAAWSQAFAPSIRGSVLDGYTAFSEADARRAGRALLRGGSVRVKPVSATGGRGQSVARGPRELDALLSSLDRIEDQGVVLERNLRSPRTLSIGQVNVGRLRASYYGLQRLTRNHRGEWVYGGSDLTVVRGDLENLSTLTTTPSLRKAIAQVRAYHAAVIRNFPGFFASRINYDVAQGLDDAGRWCSGVLEQSWRLGGASGAEISALEMFREQPERAMVHASCMEVYGEPVLPPGARVYYDGTDPDVGRLVKFSFAEAHADAA